MVRKDALQTVKPVLVVFHIFRLKMKSNFFLWIWILAISTHGEYSELL